MSSRKKNLDWTSRTKTASARSPLERLEPGRAPARPRGVAGRSGNRFLSGTVRVFSAMFTIALVSMLVASAAGLAVYHQYEAPGPLDTARPVVIPKGEGRIAIGERLEKEGVISNRWTFIGCHFLQSFFTTKKSFDLKAGEYEIKANASIRNVIDTLTEGHSVQYKVTIPEGLTSQQVVERLKAEPNLTGDIAQVPAEGSLLPDTYSFSRGASRQEIVDRMQSEMKKAVAALWDKRAPDLPLKTADEAITFASIVEKETGIKAERDHVSSVFYNRLKKGMRLQSDPTIIYGINGGAGSLGRSITKADIESKTPYNTYQINGLPPTPIANPGREALEAALNPAKTSDLFFVADGKGGHTFSETLKEHNSAVQKLRETERQAKSESAGKDTATDPDAAQPEVPPFTGDPEITSAPAAKDKDQPDKTNKANGAKPKPTASAKQPPADPGVKGLSTKTNSPGAAKPQAPPSVPAEAAAAPNKAQAAP